MARIGLLAMLSTFILACGAEQDRAPEPAAASTASEPVSPKGKKWGGWRWKGERENCFFKVEGKCFDDEDEACKAAGCKKGECRKDDRAPATISCESKKDD